jgi:3-deoxy-manno-octulosonate cytidylyltransferase (CMP-KDO synthetase)
LLRPDIQASRWSRSAGRAGTPKPLIQRSWEAAVAAADGRAVVIATDDERIAEVARGFGAEVAMTPAECANGTERCAAVLDSLPAAPRSSSTCRAMRCWTPPWFLPPLVGALGEFAAADVATPVVRASARGAIAGCSRTRRRGGSGGPPQSAMRPGGALYFQHVGDPAHGPPTRSGARRCSCMSASMRIAAPRSSAMPRRRRRRRSSWRGWSSCGSWMRACRCRLVEVDPRGCDLWELNNPSDLRPIEAALAARGIA